MVSPRLCAIITRILEATLPWAPRLKTAVKISGFLLAAINICKDPTANRRLSIVSFRSLYPGYLMPRTIHAPIDQAQRERRQDWSIDRLCRGLRISREKLEQHPHWSDVVTLLLFDPYHTWMNQEDHRVWTHCWQRTYWQELPLSPCHRQRLTHIIDGIEYRKQAYHQRQTKRQHIQARIAERRSQLAAV